MPTSNNVPQAAVRQPRGIVLVNSVQMLWLDWEVNSNSYFQADTFRVTLPVSGQRQDVDGNIDLTWFDTEPELNVEIFAGFPADPERFTIGDLNLLIEGRVDDFGYDPVSGTITLSGRDLTALLIDSTYLGPTWLNRRASDIALHLAKKHNLFPVVTKTKIIQGANSASSQGQTAFIGGTFGSKKSDWDVLCGLAGREKFYAYVKGRELHFEPRADGSNPYVLQWEKPAEGHPVFNGMRLSFSRNLTLAKDVIVKVHSWNQKQKKGFTKTAKATHNKDTVLKGAAQPTGDAQVYERSFPGKTPQQLQQIADSLLADITRHERKLTATLPADNILTPQSVIEVKGTGAYDQKYFADSIIRRMSRGGGYVMDLTAKNHDTNSELLPPGLK